LSYTEPEIAGEEKKENKLTQILTFENISCKWFLMAF
jgi:hypothetical protein